MASQPLETLGNDEWLIVLQHLALSVVAALCATSHSVRTAIDSAEVWSGLCVCHVHNLALSAFAAIVVDHGVRKGAAMRIRHVLQATRVHHVLDDVHLKRGKPCRKRMVHTRALPSFFAV